ncbi:MAG: hypothetical protein IMF19_16620, partial [Proteobacteria bacterium]|nr:hypothetical protein [Pseudomonadota bacterium]
MYNLYWLLGNCGTAFRIQKICGQWGTIPKHENGRNQYEIDIVILDEESKEIGFFECK